MKMKTPASVIAKRLLLEHVRRYKKRLALAIFFMMLTALMTASLAKLLQPIFDDVFISHNKNQLWLVAGSVLAAFVIKGFATYGESIQMAYVGQRIIADIQERLFDHLLRADLMFFHSRSSGKLISYFTNDVHLLRQAVTTTLTGIGKDILTLVFLVSLMFYQDWLLAGIAFFVFPMAIWPVAKLGKRMRRVTHNTQESMGAFHVLLQQVFQGMCVVKTYGMEGYEKVKAQVLIERLFSLTVKAGRVRSASHPIMETLGGFAIVVIIFYGGTEVIEGNRTTGSFISFITALLLAYEPMKRLANLNANLQEGLAAADRIFHVLDTPATIINRPHAHPLVIQEGCIAFKDVSFSYPGGNKALSAISLLIPGGKKVALVGPSGSGKSTILNLIPRFYDIACGSIQIDGQEIAHRTLDSLRQHIALVTQEITLFDDTVWANIAYGKEGASVEEIVCAAKSAAAHDFIMKLSLGYNTIVGEHGVKLSGGQRQRLSIARAMLKNAPILLLDEATSALDSESERAVQEALDHLMEGRTTLVVAHRLSTVMNADYIYVIDKGGVSEYGTHEQLMKQKGTYANYVALQLMQD